MKASQRIFQPFPLVAIPVFQGLPPLAALSLARALGGRTHLVGLIRVAPESPVSAEAQSAREMRRELRTLAQGLPGNVTQHILVAHNPWQELTAALAAETPDLLVLDWEVHCTGSGCIPAELLARPVCDLAVVRGVLPEQPACTLAPVRGGPFAELAIRLGLALPHRELTVLNLSPTGDPQALEAPFRGLARILPSLVGVTYRRGVSDHPVETILEEARQANLLVLGASAQPESAQGGIGPVVQRVLLRAACPAVVVKTHDPLPEKWTGPEGERLGAQAISLLVDRWFAENTYHADEFDDLARLVELKRQQNLSISLALPALNEEATVGSVIAAAKKALMDEVPLLDEIVLIDSNSTDGTRSIAAAQGVPVYIHQQLLPAHGPRRGKGEALWKSLLVTRGDIVVWIDTDIINIHPRFVYGVIGPMLVNPQIQFVKGFYQRPIKNEDTLQPGGGGRVTELVARPLINLFYPELSGVLQPLAGEYGGRRKALETLTFYSGYGVEIGLLIDVFEKFGLGAIAQVDLLERIHHNQTLEALSKMSFAIVQTVLHKLEKRFNRSILEEVNKTMKLIHYQEGRYYLEVEEVAERDRPPMVEVEEYRQAHRCAARPPEAHP